MTHLANDDARCNGVNIDGHWREGCEDCRRRTDPRPEMVWSMAPPEIVVFECEFRIAPEGAR